MKKLYVALSFAALGFAFWSRRADAEQSLPATGQAAPDFTLPSQDGSPVRLKDLRGKWVVLYFYPKDNTPGCTVEAHRFQVDQPKYEQANAVVLGVSLDSAASHEKFCTKQGLTFKLLADTGHDVTARYGSLNSILGFKIAARNTFLINPKGRIAQVWKGVEPSRHSDEVLQTIAGLQTPKT